ncbi:MAG: Rrf2 family transcriptional regulator [Candidatus Eisenbacteria bacterium]
MLTQTARYALHCLGFLANSDGSRIPGQTIAEATGIPANYLSKILNQLRKHGIVDAEKGWGGGFQLREGAVERPILDVVEILEGSDNSQVEGCLFGLPECNPKKPCPLHSHWAEIKERYRTMLSGIRIADLATNERTRARPTRRGSRSRR